MLRVAMRLLNTHVSVGVRRLREGPRHPAWGWRAETLVTFMQQGRVFDSGRPPERLRHGLDATAKAAPLPWGVRFEKTEIVGLTGEWIRPTNAAERGLLLYLHGGGYVVGSTDTHRGLTARLARAGRLRTLSVNYRLAPEAPFPAAVDDTVAVYRALLASGVDPAELVLAGDSAGGGLALAALVRLRDEGTPLPAGAILLSPWVDLSARNGSIETLAEFDFLRGEALGEYVDHYLQGADARHPLASPLYAELAGLPPLMIQVGGAELFFDQVEALARRAREAGVEVTLTIGEGMFHVWQAFAAVLPEARASFRELGAWLQARLRATASARGTDPGAPAGES